MKINSKLHPFIITVRIIKLHDKKNTTLVIKIIFIERGKLTTCVSKKGDCKILMTKIYVFKH